MIYLILDVHYQDNGDGTHAHVGAIRFTGIERHTILNHYQLCVPNVAPYQSGQFYQREMPCLLALLVTISEPFDVIIIDGYVYLDGQQKAGLGKHLYDHLPTPTPIIGIAKNRFIDISEHFAVYRGISKHPLYVTSIGIDDPTTFVKQLQGKHRLPDIVSQVDELSRSTNRPLHKNRPIQSGF